jgi:hypothetical protein
MPAGTLPRLIALAAIVLIVGAGLCLFDGDQSAGGDLCLLLVVTTGLLPAFPLAPTGHLLPALVKSYRRYSPDLPAPPPKA